MRSLAKLSGVSYNALARDIGMDSGNFSRFVARGGPIGPEPRAKLRRRLGVVGQGKLQPRLHLWVVGETLEALVDVLRQCLPDREVAELVVVRPRDAEDSKPASLGDDAIYGLRALRWRAILRRKIGANATEWQALLPENLPQVDWLHRDGGAASVAVDEADFARWRDGRVSIRQFDAVVRAPAELSWSDVESLAIEEGLTPRDLRRLILRRSS